MISLLLILVRIIEVKSIFQPDKSHHFFLAAKMYTQKNLLKATIPICICQRLIRFTVLWHKLIMKRRMFPTFICFYKAVDRIFYRFTSVKTRAWRWENTRKLCKSRVGSEWLWLFDYNASYPKESTVYCLDKVNVTQNSVCLNIFYGFTGAVNDKNWSIRALLVTQLFQLFKSGSEKT